MEHQRKGTLDTCEFPKSQNLSADRPTKDGCWRVAFRFQLQESKDANGFLIQVEEKNVGLSAGQKIKAEMAKEVGLKVFRTYTDDSYLYNRGMQRISNAVQEWYKSGCANRDLENVFLGFDDTQRRPRYEKL